MSLSFFDKIIYLNSVDSTNTHLKESVFEESTVVYTFNQYKGRGRNNKNWVDTKNKNIALSFLLNKFNNFNNNLWYTAATSIALLNILEELNIQNYWIKWPNDVYIGEKKLAGILTESIWRSDKLDKLVIGIGINVNCNNNDLIKVDALTTSIYLETGKEQNLKDFISNYILELSKQLYLLEDEKGLTKIREKWINNCRIVNLNVEWINGSKKRNGIICDIELDGSLVFKDLQNNTHKIISGEVKILKK